MHDVAGNIGGPAQPRLTEETYMAGASPYPDTGAGPDRGSTTGPPRWVKVVGIATIALVLLVVLMMFTGGGGGSHGPARHTQFDSAGAQTPSVTADRAPPGGDLGGHTRSGIPDHDSQ